MVDYIEILILSSDPKKASAALNPLSTVRGTQSAWIGPAIERVSCFLKYFLEMNGTSGFNHIISEVIPDESLKQEHSCNS